MSYGMRIYVPNYSFGFDLTSGWMPSYCLGTISLTVSVPARSPVTQTFSKPDGVRLVAFPLSQSLNLSDDRGWASDIDIVQSTGEVTLSQTLTTTNSDVGKVVTWGIYGFWESSAYAGGYGVLFPDSNGLDGYLTDAQSTYICRYRYTSSATTNTTLTINTGISSSVVKRIIPFVGDSNEDNAISAYPYSSGGVWYVRINRGRATGYAFGGSNGDPTNAAYSGVVKIAVFSEFTESIDSVDYGFAIYGDSGMTYASSAPPLMIKGFYAIPTASISSPPFSNNNYQGSPVVSNGGESIGTGGTNLYFCPPLGVGRFQFWTWSLGLYVSGGILSTGTIHYLGTSSTSSQASGVWAEPNGMYGIPYVFAEDYDM